MSVASASQTGSVADLQKKKKKDQLKLFEKKMTLKFKSLNSNQSMSGASKKKLGKIGSLSNAENGHANTIVLNIPKKKE